MCNTYPRPRCSHHTHEKLVAEVAALQQLLDEAKSHKRTPKILSEKISWQERRVELARRQFNCTKRGIETLEGNLSKTNQSTDRLDYAYYERSLEQAREDANNHKTVGAIFDAYSDNTDPISDTDVVAIREKRNHISERIAQVSNVDPNPASVTPLERQYDAATKDERRAVQKFLLRTRGIKHPVRDLSPATSSESTYTFVPAQEFGHLSKELPRGCYAEVTDIKVTPEGNYVGKIEGVKETLFPSSTPFITQRTS